MNETLGLKSLNAPEIVRKFKHITGGYVNIGRDSKLMKEFLDKATPAQILYGIYQFRDAKTITIPIFLRHHEEWLIEDEIEAEIELAALVSETIHPSYMIWHDYRYDNNAYAVNQAETAFKELVVWADRTLS